MNPEDAMTWHDRYDLQRIEVQILLEQLNQDAEAAMNVLLRALEDDA